MTREKESHSVKKPPPDRKYDQKIIDAIKEHSLDGKIPCAVAFSIAGDLKVPPAEVGVTLDFLETKIVKCQLGLFGYQPQKNVAKPAESVSSELEEAIRAVLVNDRLPCAAAWEIAKRFELPKMGVCSACETLKIKISDCQLLTF
jgi:hypothetical protein